jgi:hypothetical protein
MGDSKVARPLLLGVLCLLALCCSQDEGLTPPDPNRVFDFTLTDVNPNSSTYQQRVSLTSLRGHPFVLYAGSAG